MLFRPHVGKIYGLNTWYTELENSFEIFQGKANKKCHGRTLLGVTDGKNVNQCYFFGNFQKIEAKVYQCVGIHIWIKKVNDSIFLYCAVFDL